MDELVAILIAIIAGIFQVIAAWIGSRSRSGPEAAKRTVRNSSRRTKAVSEKPGKFIFSRRTVYWMLGFGAVAYIAISGYNRMALNAFLKANQDPCPNRQNIPGSDELDVEVNVKSGYAAYFMGWQFDGEDGGFFVTFDGPYHASHTFGGGIYCPAVPADTDLSQGTVTLLTVNCQDSEGGCSKTRTCSQHILAYFLGGGECHAD